jgi:ketosteroid isomerase-like protein
VKLLYSEPNDVPLANPLTACDELARYTSDDLATILEIEHWRASIGDRNSVDPFDLRVTTTFRRESGEWTIVHRHADPISTPDESGPLRTA